MSWQDIVNSIPLGTKPTKPTQADENPSSVGIVGIVPKGEIMKSVSPDPLRWPRFVTLCAAHDVTAEQVRAMFTERDIDDLCTEPDEKLAKHAATIAGAIKRLKWSQAMSPTTTAARTYTERVRCGRCNHFRFHETQPATGLGTCTVRDDVNMGAPSRQIACNQYQQRPKS